MKSRRQASEEGVVLIMTLIFISMIGLIAGALLSYDKVVNRQAFSARKVQAREAGTNSGMEWAVNSLRQGKDTFCIGTYTREVLTIGGREVEVLCKGSGSGTSGKNSFALYVNPGSPVNRNEVATSGASNSLDKHIIGPVYNAGGWSLGADLYIDGDVQVPGALLPDGSCPTAAVPARLHPLYGTLKACSVPLTAVTPAAIPAACMTALCTDQAPLRYDELGTLLAVGNTKAETCRVFSPGLYTSVPALAGLNYFKPGIYYFEFNQTWKINTALLGGDPRPASVDVQAESVRSTVPKCLGAPAATTQGGVVFVLGRKAAISVGNNGRMELFSYQANPGEASPPNIVTVWPGVADWAGTHASTVPLSQDLIHVGVAQPEFVLHAGVFAPDSSLDLKGSNNAIQLVLNTVVVARFDMQASASINPDNFGLKVPTGAVKRYILVANSCPGSLTGMTSDACSSLTGGTLEPQLCTVAAVEVYDDANRTVWIKDWRVDREPGTSSDGAACALP